MTELSRSRILKNGNGVPYVFRPEIMAAVKPETLPDAEPSKEKSAGSEEQAKQIQKPPPKQEEQKEEAERILKAAREEKERILEEARREAEALKKETLEKAALKAEEMKEEARSEGWEEGYKEGAEQGKKEQEELQKKWFDSFGAEMEEALRSVSEAKERCLSQYLGELKDCSVAVAEKVIHISLQSSGEVIRQMIVAATEKLKKTAWVKIYMDRPDYERMIRADADILEELSHLSDNIKFVVMDREEEGSCIIERPEEVLDISVNTQLENIKDILANP